MRFFATVVLTLMCMIAVSHQMGPAESPTYAYDRTARQKRFLIFSGSGVVKLVLGISFPIVLPDKSRSLNGYYNVQMQYTPPPRPLYWWSFYNTTTFAERRRRAYQELTRDDNSRRSLYNFLESEIQRNNRSMSELETDCLPRLVCEMARAPMAHDSEWCRDTDQGHPISEDNGLCVYHELINAILTPYISNVDHRYMDAKTAGFLHKDCALLFQRCHVVDKLLRWFLPYDVLKNIATSSATAATTNT